jgi:AcrR family transcriptional regulator
VRDIRSSRTPDGSITAASCRYSEYVHAAHASTRELAAAGGVTERTLFRHFPVKPLLFQAAVVEPFHAAIAGYVVKWEGRQHGIREPGGETMELFVELFDVLSANKGLVQALIAANAFDPRSVDTGGPSMAGLLDRLQKIMEVEASDRGWRLDAEITIRLMFGMLVSATVHADWLFGSTTPDRDRMLAELVGLSVHGMAHRSHA